MRFVPVRRLLHFCTTRWQTDQPNRPWAIRLGPACLKWRDFCEKCLTGFILFVALLLLNIPISAAVQPAVIYDAETNPVRAQVWNAQGELVWVDVVNAQGGIDYLQTPAGGNGSIPYLPPRRLPGRRGTGRSGWRPGITSGSRGRGTTPSPPIVESRSWKRLSPVFRSPSMQLPKRSWPALERR